MLRKINQKSMTTVTGITSITILLQISPFKMFWIGVAMFCVMGILYQLYITDFFFFERNAVYMTKARKSIETQIQRLQLINLGHELPDPNKVIKINIRDLGLYSVKESEVAQMSEYHFDWLVIKLLGSHEATELMADSYRYSINRRILERGYYRTKADPNKKEAGSTSPLFDSVTGVYIDNQEIMPTTEEIGERLDNILDGEKAPSYNGETIEFEPYITTRPKRGRIRH